jgi:hypothetical protein
MFAKCYSSLRFKILSAFLKHISFLRRLVKVIELFKVKKTNFSITKNSEKEKYERKKNILF